MKKHKPQKKPYTKTFNFNPAFYSKGRYNPAEPCLVRRNKGFFILKSQRAKFKGVYKIILRARSKFKVYSVKAYREALCLYIDQPKTDLLYSPFKSRYKMFLKGR